MRAQPRRRTVPDWHSHGRAVRDGWGSLYGLRRFPLWKPEIGLGVSPRRVGLNFYGLQVDGMVAWVSKDQQKLPWRKLPDRYWSTDKRDARRTAGKREKL